MNVWEFLDRHGAAINAFLKGTLKDVLRAALLMLVLYGNAETFDQTEWTAGGAYLTIMRVLGLSTKEKVS